MADPHFAHTLTYVCEHNQDGALGIVVNKPIDMTLSALFEQIDVPLADDALRVAPVHFGGPVQIDRGFVLHRPLGNWQSTLAISDDMGLTTSKDVLEAVGRGDGPEGRVRLARLRGLVGGPARAGARAERVAHRRGRCRRVFDLPAERRLPAAMQLARHRLLAAVRGRRARVTRDRAPPPATVLAFDFGTRRIGVAVGNTLTRSRAAADDDRRRTRDDARFAAIAALIARVAAAAARRRHSGACGRHAARDDGARAALRARSCAARFGLPVATGGRALHDAARAVGARRCRRARPARRARARPGRRADHPAGMVR